MDRRLLVDAPAWQRLPAELPITERRDELVAAIADNQVVVVAGETGSGKSTQLPKLCVQANRGVHGLIGHTQPRRLAARAVAQRVADETESRLGQQVGYAVRFDDRVGPETVVKLMTDGILLAELQRDRKLSAYDTIIIDEAHERSLNIDFLLGYLKQLLPQRPDLHVIITSATIDTERFSRHFNNAPVLEVSGRTYPVDVRYRPLGETADGASRDSRYTTQAEHIADTVRSLWREDDGDMLVFLPGERDIREAAEELENLNLHNTEIFPLYARLSAGEQQRVFQPHNQRRVVLATNVAETSVTVPGIRFVVDTGMARVSRYNRRTKVQRLPIEAVSQASADQRAGRCGRVGPGICVRLYDEADFLGRPEFTEPEILRTNLASVILQMASLGLGDISEFPFVEPPDAQSIRDGVALLEELDALDPEHHDTDRWLTPMGTELARFPIDPRFARMIIEAVDRDALDEVTIIVAALSIQDPRERPRDRQTEATQAHARHVDDRSDFLTLVNLWRYLEQQRQELSGNQFRRRCRKEYLNYNRVREWQDTVRQLRRTVKELGYRPTGPSKAHADTVHRCLLTGLLSQVGNRDSRAAKAAKANQQRSGGRRRTPVDYAGTRGSRFRIGRSSALSKAGPQWVMAAELVETDQLWAHTVGPVDPAWIEDAAHYLVKRSYDEPQWDPGDGVAYTIERVSLYGLPIVAGRRITVGRINPRLGRELFIHHALVLGDADIGEPFQAANGEVSSSLDALEDRFRRRASDGRNDHIHRFFDRRVPDHVSSVASFRKWRKKPAGKAMNFELTLDDVLTEAEQQQLSDYPDAWPYRDAELELNYLFDQGDDRDGLSVHVPIELAAQLQAAPFAWLVPAMRPELLMQLLRTLPKEKRKQLAPLDEAVNIVLNSLPGADTEPGADTGTGPTVDGYNIERSPTELMADTLGRRLGVALRPEDFDPSRLPAFLRPTFRVLDRDRRLIAEGKSLGAVKALIVEQTESALASVAREHDSPERDDVTQWDFGDLPTVFTTETDGRRVRAYPALVDEGDGVAIRLLADAERQADEMWGGTRRLLRLQLPSPIRSLDRLLSDRVKLILVTGVVQTKSEWYNDVLNVCLDEAIIAAGGPPWTAAGFAALATDARASLSELLELAAGHCEDLVPLSSSISQRLEALKTSANLATSATDAGAHFRRLAYPGFLTGVGLPRLDDMVRYLSALEHRLQQLPDNPGRDSKLAAESVAVENQHRHAVARLGLTPELEDIGWELEELRLQNFAQHLRRRPNDQSAGRSESGAASNAKISAKRIQSRLGNL